MSDVPITNAEAGEVLLAALGVQLAAAGVAYDLVVVGGSALLAMGLMTRATKDVDVLAVRAGTRLDSAEPLPPALVAARDRVARDFGLKDNWLNAGPASLLDFALPEGFEGRLATRRYGSHLTVRFAARLDQIYFKFYAAVDHNGPGKHLSDLTALEPTHEELIGAARWSRLHDPSEAHRELLTSALAHLGVHDADLGA